MKPFKIDWRLLPVALALLALPGRTMAGDDVPTVVIANPAVADATLTDKEVQNAYLGKKTQWRDGRGMSLVTTSDNRVHESFLKRFIKKTPSQFRIFWKRMEFTGQGVTPRELATEEDVITHVKNTDGAMGYVSADKAAASGCKILAQYGE